MDDTSLDDFLASESEGDGDEASPDESTTGTEPSTPVEEDGNGGESGEEGSPESEAEPADPPDESPDTDSVAPATTTSRWVGGGEPCAVCESAAERLWESADGLVCVSCKEW